jgi:5-(carboxyamino)imidazole ribonucleotide synthase
MHIAIYGCGQLAQMLAQAAHQLGHETLFISEPDEDTTCVKNLGLIYNKAAFIDGLMHKRFPVDVLTVEKEHVDIAFLNNCETFIHVHPNPQTIKVCGNRWLEKTALQSMEIPVADFFDLMSLPQGEVKGNGFIVKSCLQGYDGKNQYRVNNLDEVSLLPLGDIFPKHWIVESKVPFDFEFSIIAARDLNGDKVFYPSVYNQHQQGILHISIAPAPQVSETIYNTVCGYMNNLLEIWNYVGVLTMECFAVGDKVIVNELAPRVHNSGHWSLFDVSVSQFENHIRCITCMPVKSVEFSGIRAMYNLVGKDEVASIWQAESQKQVTRYGKKPKVGRKLGHINLKADSLDAVQSELELVENYYHADSQNVRLVS